jgi:hypothetical protein
MAKQQTLTIVVADDMADPVDLVETALERFLLQGPIRPEYGDDPAVELEERSPTGYLLLEED